MNLSHLIHTTAALHPERVAIAGDGGATLSYGDLARRVEAAAAFLRARRVQAGEVVALGLPQSPFWQWVLLLGALRLGAQPAVLGARPMPELSALGQPLKVVCAAGSAMSRVAGLQVVAVRQAELHALTTTQMVMGLPAAESTNPSAALLEIGQADHPRAVRLAGQTLASRLQAAAAAHGLDAQSRVMVLLGAQVGHAVECGLATLQAGGTLVLPGKPAAAAQLVVSAEVNRLIVSGDILGAMLRLGQPIGDPRARRLSLVGAPLLAGSIAAVRAHVAAEAAQVGWAAEAGVFASLDAGALPASGGTLGRPLPGVELGVVPASGPGLPPGGGLIRLRTPWMADAYIETTPVRGPRGLHEGWFLTGLIGFVEADGLWRVVVSTNRRQAAPGGARGRKSSWTRGDLEGLLGAVDGVQACCVLGGQQRAGEPEVPVVVYVGEAAPASLQQALAAQVGPHLTCHLVRVPTLPRLPDGSVDRAAVASALQRTLARELARQQASASA